MLTLVTCRKLDWPARKSALVRRARVRPAWRSTVEPLDRRRLPGWIAQRLARRASGRAPSRSALDFIADRVEGNLLAAHQEIAEARRCCTRQRRADAASRSRTPCSTSRATTSTTLAMPLLARRRRARCARMLDGLRAEGAAPPLVLWALAAELRSCWRCARGRIARGQPAAGAQGRAGVRQRRPHASRPALRRSTGRAPALGALRQAARHRPR
ncbi:MAG: hypothetical protein MZV65_45350 [Chromatiales bacterium]|nr:hypothetical protein [Chromatiales bacterium]